MHKSQFWNIHKVSQAHLLRKQGTLLNAYKHLKKYKQLVWKVDDLNAGFTLLYCSAVIHYAWYPAQVLLIMIENYKNQPCEVIAEATFVKNTQTVALKK